MSFIKKKNEKGSSMWDWIVFAAIIIGGLGFWWYYKTQQSSTISGFSRADSLFQAGNHKEALTLYEDLRKSDYLEPAHDSILSERLDTLYTIFEEREQRKKLLKQEREKPDALQDTTAAGDSP